MAEVSMESDLINVNRENVLIWRINLNFYPLIVDE